jgi:hypothetical protein
MQLDRLEQEARRMGERLQELLLLLDGGEGLDTGPPPHYGQRK